MKKNKILLVVLILAAVALCLFSCFDGLRHRDPYTAYEITKVDIIQNTANNFHYEIACDILPSDTAKVYITRYDRIGDSDEALAYTAKDGKYSFNADVSYSSYFIHVVDGEMIATLPMTRPQMAPTLTSSAGSNIVTYNFVNGTSWSSFCDPTGKSVYKSSSTQFDENAELVAKKIAIFGVDSTTDVNASEDKPYYYVVLSAKNGIVTYVSAPLMTIEHAYSDLNVSMSDESGVPTLKVSGKFVIDGDVALEFYSADTKLGKVLEIVGNRVTGAAGEPFEVTLDMSKVVNGTTGAGIWYDIKLASASGSLYELSESNADMFETLKSKNITFEFKAWNSILKLNYQYYDYSVSSLVIEEVEGVPTLMIKGAFDSSALRDIKLHGDAQADGKGTDLLWDNISENDGEFEFCVPLTELPTEGTPWVWFHIYTYKGNATINSGKDDLPRGSALSIGQTFTYDNVTYTIQAYQGTGIQLAIEAKAE